MARGGGGKQKLVGELNGTGAVLELGVAVTLVDELLDLLSAFGEFVEGLEHFVVVAPVGGALLCKGRRRVGSRRRVRDCVKIQSIQGRKKVARSAYEGREEPPPQDFLSVNLYNQIACFLF